VWEVTHVLAVLDVRSIRAERWRKQCGGAHETASWGCIRCRGGIRWGGAGSVGPPRLTKGWIL
jgi:hypothetical protein